MASLALDNRLDAQGTGSIGFGATCGITLAGAEIAAFDPESDRFFVTSGEGLQVVGLNEALDMTLLGTIALGTKTQSLDGGMTKDRANIRNPALAEAARRRASHSAVTGARAE